MSRGSEALSRKINGAKDLSAVVRSMKALAASSIAQYEQSVASLQDYARTAELGLSVCLREMGATGGGLEKSTALTRGAIIFGSDQGLVGRFNEVLMEYAARTLGALPGDTSHLWVTGDRMRELVSEAGLPSPTYLPVPHSIDGILPLVNQLLIGLETAREKDHVKEIYVYHNQPLPSAGYRPVSKRLLPFDAIWQRELTALRWATRMVPEVLGENAAALQAFIREYLFVLLFQACAQSLASENASRLAAMQRAEENITDVLRGLTRRFHRIRQESIDEELFEVVSGYEALSTGRGGQ
jgi:F-type H+-transporting ATPase subunit gamma